VNWRSSQGGGGGINDGDSESRKARDMTDIEREEQRMREMSWRRIKILVLYIMAKDVLFQIRDLLYSLPMHHSHLLSFVSSPS